MSLLLSKDQRYLEGTSWFGKLKIFLGGGVVRVSAERKLQIQLDIQQKSFETQAYWFKYHRDADKYYRLRREAELKLWDDMIKQNKLYREACI